MAFHRCHSRLVQPSSAWLVCLSRNAHSNSYQLAAPSLSQSWCSIARPHRSRRPRLSICQPTIPQGSAPAPQYSSMNGKGYCYNNTPWNRPKRKSKPVGFPQGEGSKPIVFGYAQTEAFVTHISTNHVPPSPGSLIKSSPSIAPNVSTHPLANCPRWTLKLPSTNNPRGRFIEAISI